MTEMTPKVCFLFLGLIIIRGRILIKISENKRFVLRVTILNKLENDPLYT